jgi:hypothetical protein
MNAGQPASAGAALAGASSRGAPVMAQNAVGTTVHVTIPTASLFQCPYSFVWC